MKDSFDFIIIDEAAQATEPESLLPIGHTLVRMCFNLFLLFYLVLPVVLLTCSLYCIVRSFYRYMMKSKPGLIFLLNL